MILGQGFGIRDIQRRAPQPAFLAGFGPRFERGYQGVLVEDLAAADVRDEGAAFGQDGEFVRAEEVGCFFRERHADEQLVDVLREEVVEGLLVQAAVPGAGDGAVRVPRARHDEAVVFFRLGRRARAGGVGDHVHAHGLGDAADLAADAAVAEDAEALADVIADGVEIVGFVGAFAPFVGALPVVQFVVVVGVHEGGEEDPFGDLGAVYAGRGCYGDGG